MNFNTLLDDYDTAIFLAHPLVQPLGLVIKANTDGAEGVQGVANTFVYTVLLMVITGLTMYLVYGRTNRRGAGTSGGRKSGGRKSGKGRRSSQARVTVAEAAPVPDAAPLPAGRP